MYNKISVENYKIFKDKTEFKIAPLTILVGPNNSGKSTITKLLLLLKKGVNPLNFNNGKSYLSNFNNCIPWNSDSEEFKITIPCSNLAIPEELDLELTYDKNNDTICQYCLTNKKETLLMIKNDYHTSNSFYMNFNFNYLINLILEKEISPLKQKINSEDNLQNYTLQNFKERLNLTKKLKSERFHLFALHFSFDKQAKYLPKLYKQRTKEDLQIEIDKIDLQIFNTLKEEIDYHNKALFNEIKLLENKQNLLDIYIKGELKTDYYYDDIIRIQNKVINDFNGGSMEYDEDFNDIFKDSKAILEYMSNEILRYIDLDISNISSEDFAYINEYTPIDYHTTPTILFELIFNTKYYINEHNKSLLDYILTPFYDVENQFKNINYLSAKRGTQNRVYTAQTDPETCQIIADIYHSDILNTNDKNTDNYIASALQLFGLKCGRIKIEELEKTAWALFVYKNNKWTNIADLGFGFSQLVPIMLKVLNVNLQSKVDSKNKELIVLEEPESNLHPNLQSKLAEFFVLTIKNFPQIQFVIETHSEYLIRKLQYLTAKGEIESDKISINYFNADENVTAQEPKVKHIGITETGNLTDSFGAGFLDETTKLQFELLMLNNEQKN